jgi:hypothetical protein
MRKYSNTKVEHQGITFDSKAEMRRYQALALLQQAGEISDLTLQPSFELQPAFKDGRGRKHRPIVYQADFSYTEAGRRVVEDVKGAKTREYRLKAKILLYRWPDLDFREVGA